MNMFIACTAGTAFTITGSAVAMKPAANFVLASRAPAAVPAINPPWEELRTDLLRWEKSPADWDGDHGIAPPAPSLAAAKTVIGKLKAAHIVPPDASVSGDGEIAYTWSRATAFASISFLADGHLVAYSRVAGHDTIEIDQPYQDDLDLMAMFESLRDIA
ncbi:hypothetical protein K7957_07625 [Sphingomonas yunnanensis]|uniref:hypothetical protein n=1 Tax=Sphingomonas yunnanensis TaxID=310400 RepID=UPI001CA674F0|nr:hypothetical protein [Sphingomonas yunnanensis]MBY9062797.1 hypothetical protein [Sphingomonas yunnanensis]